MLCYKFYTNVLDVIKHVFGQALNPARPGLAH